MRNRKKRSRWPLLLLLLLILAVPTCLWLAENGLAEAPGLMYLLHPADDSQGWQLTLVNAKHYLPRDHEIEFTTLSNGETIDSRIYPELQAMFDAARADGLQLFVASGYRTWDRQRQLLADKVEDYLEEGCGQMEARRLARQWVALPGTSEHQLGLAVDINAEGAADSDQLYAWLEANSYKYGFINRYPADKTAVTGTINEPWHYRYVGQEAATAMHEQGLCLEEYLQSLE